MEGQDSSRYTYALEAKNRYGLDTNEKAQSSNSDGNQDLNAGSKFPATYGSPTTVHYRYVRA